MAEFIEIMDKDGKRILLNIDAISHICEGRKKPTVEPCRIVMTNGDCIEISDTSYEKLRDFLTCSNKII